MPTKNLFETKIVLTLEVQEFRFSVFDLFCYLRWRRPTLRRYGTKQKTLDGKLGSHAPNTLTEQPCERAGHLFQLCSYLLCRMELIIELMKLTEVMGEAPGAVLICGRNEGNIVAAQHLPSQGVSQQPTRIKNVTSSRLGPLHWALPISIQFYLNSTYVQETYEAFWTKAKSWSIRSPLKGQKISKSCNFSWTKSGYKLMAWRGIRIMLTATNQEPQLFGPGP